MGRFRAKGNVWHFMNRSLGLFERLGNIEKGREILLYLKGQILSWKQITLDSAEYYFRKELKDGKDFNNQNGGAKGFSPVSMICNKCQTQQPNMLCMRMK